VSALARPILADADAAAQEAVVVSAEITGGHDGTAELTVLIRFENGVTAPTVLDGDTGMELMKACGAASLDGLVGQSWRELLKGL
jgi:hypothetical protein